MEIAECFRQDSGDATDECLSCVTTAKLGSGHHGLVRCPCTVPFSKFRRQHLVWCCTSCFTATQPTGWLTFVIRVMSLLLPIRRGGLRFQRFIPRRAVAAQTHALFLQRSRQSSTFCPTNLAELLRPASPLSSTLPQGSWETETETLTIHGYVRSVRKQKRIAFAVIGDGSTLQTVQAVLSPQLAEELV